MRVRHISVRNLFGIFNHDIPLNQDDRITIIYGPNGYGKTYTLRLVNALLNPADTDFRDFFRIPFAELAVTFGNDAEVTIKKKNSGLDIEYTSSGDSKHLHLGNPAERLKGIVDDPETEHVIADVISNKKHALPEWLKSLKEQADIRFIRTERLTSFSETEQSIVHSVNLYSRELGGLIERTLARYAELSQSLDRTFPMRLIRDGGDELPLDALKQRLRELEDKRSRLTAVGLLDPEAVDLDALDEATDANRTVLSVYLADAEQKLAMFDDLVGKIELLVNIVNGRFLQKKIGIDRRAGFRFTAADGRPLDPENLSSGEQHVVVLMYELLFKVRPDTLILIDEPELSLHVYWQQQFLCDLADIIKLAHFDALIATHSPQIIHDRWDLAVELKGPSA